MIDYSRHTFAIYSTMSTAPSTRSYTGTPRSTARAAVVTITSNIAFLYEVVGLVTLGCVASARRWIVGNRNNRQRTRSMWRRRTRCPDHLDCLFDNIVRPIKILPLFNTTGSSHVGIRGSTMNFMRRRSRWLCLDTPSPHRLVTRSQCL
jgi:hypothetical protein